MGESVFVGQMPLPDSLQCPYNLDFHTYGDEYNNRFESKLQLPKWMHDEHPYAPLMSMVRFCEPFLEQFFDMELEAPDHDYWDAIFMYRPGDYLQYHLDSSIHDGWRKLVTCNLYLTNCRGGEFQIRDNVIRVEHGTLVAFTNEDDAYHGVWPIKEDNRVMITMGFGRPASTARPNMTRTNDRAEFVPYPNERWTNEQYKEAEERAH